MVFFIFVTKESCQHSRFSLNFFSRSGLLNCTQNPNGLLYVYGRNIQVILTMAGNVNDEEVDPILLVNKLTPHFLCPVCGQLYRNPVINIKCGHTFCKNCASGCSRCPVDDEQCDSSQLIVNRL